MGAWVTKGKFKSVPEILLDLGQAQRAALHQHFRGTFEGVQSMDFDKLSRLVTENASMRQMAMDALRGFFNEQMRMPVVD